MSENKILKSSLVVISLTVLGKVLALVRDALVASKFGASNGTDIYMCSLGIVYLLTTISYGLTTTFIPLHTEKIEKGNKDEKNTFVNNVLSVSTLFTIIITLITIVFAKYIVFLYVPGFTKDPVVYSKVVFMLRIMMLSLLFINVQSVITGVLQSHKKFFAPGAMAFAANVVYIAYLLIFATKFGIEGFAVATVFAFFVQLAINLPQYKGLGYKFKPVLDFKDSSLKKLFVLMIPVIISTSVVQLNLFVDRFFASQSYSGAVTTLDFANKINTLGYEVIAIAIAMVIYPSLASFAVRKEMDEYRKMFLKALNFLVMLMIPLAIGMSILSLPLVNVIFRRGAFTDSDAIRTASALFFYTPAMVAYGVRDVLNKAFYSMKDTKTPMINSFIGILINIVLDIVLIKYMAVAGLALATTISLAITTVVLIIKLNNKYLSINFKSLGIVVMKITFAASIMGIFVYLINHMIIKSLGNSMKANLISICLSFLIGALVYFITIILLKIEELSLLKTIFKKRSLKN